MDPVTLAPTDILDPRAQAWIQTVTGGAHASLKVSTKLTFVNSVLCSLVTNFFYSSGGQESEREGVVKFLTYPIDDAHDCMS